MFKNIAFVGGIHGVGKSTICQKICDDLDIIYLSASEVLKWKAIKHDYKDKKVVDIPFTQDQLLIGLRNLVKQKQNYLLDGHFCLWNNQHKISKVPKEIFKEINPSSIAVITGEIANIRNRLEIRDGLPYNYDLLEEMQSNEVEYAKSVAEYLQTPFIVAHQNDYSAILECIKLTLNK